MKSLLNDIISHTLALDGIKLIKVVGTDKETQISAVDQEKTVIISGKLINPSADFIGTFGMPNLDTLKTILGFEDYGDGSTITMKRDANDTPTNIHFSTKTADFVNDYRLMNKALVDSVVKSVTFNGAAWNVDFAPSVASIMRLKRQSQANSDENAFSVKVENGDLKIYFGDPATHSGNFVFQPSVGGTLSKTWMWPVKQFLSVMDLCGDKTIKISDSGVAEIIVDSGVGIYTYWMPAQSK